jgi:methionine salvage enolase-phosphatase E1
MAGIVPIPIDHGEGAASKEDVIEAAVKNIQAQMALDRKTRALKQLQGHIWNSGYASGEIKGQYVLHSILLYLSIIS